MVKIARLNDSFLEVFLTARKPSRRSITAAKRKEKEKKERRKKFQNRKAQRRKSLSQNFDFCACPGQNVVKRDANGKKLRASCRVASAFSTRLKLIWLRSSQKATKMSKKRIFCKNLQKSMG